MSAGEPTPGPWSATAVPAYSVDDDGTVHIEFDGPPHCWSIWRRYRDDRDRRCHRPVAEVFVVGQEWDAAEANARLIAAAPDYVEARRSLFDAIAHGDEGHRVWLKDAIDAHFAAADAKARGA